MSSAVRRPAMGKGRCGVVVRRGNRRALAYPLGWGTGERRLLGAPDGSWPPLAASRLSYPFTEFLAFLLTGAMGAIFHSPPYQQSLSLCVYVCAVCASLAPVCEVPPASHIQ